MPHGEALNGLCETIIARDAATIDAARARVVADMGEKGMADAVATIAAFNAYPRAADATGIPLEDLKREKTEALRAELGLDALDTANTG